MSWIEDEDEDLRQAAFERARKDRDVFDRLTGITSIVEQLHALTDEELSRLADIERMMVDDVKKEARHLRCGGCKIWLTALLKKAKGLEWR